MLNKNPNNLSWKNKLEEVEGLSGETLLDKNTAWNKLYQRLQPKRRSIKALWYWAAAACLFIAMLFTWLTTSKKQPILVKIELPQAAQKINMVKVTSSQQPKKNMEIARIEIGKSTITTNAFHLTKKVTTPKIPLQKGTILLKAPLSQAAITPLQIMEQPLAQDKQVVKVMALLNNTKKLSVVHINELGDPVQEMHNSHHIVDYRTIQIKLINQEVYTNALPAIINPGFNIFKTTNAPSN